MHDNAYQYDLYFFIMWLYFSIVSNHICIKPDLTLTIPFSDEIVVEWIIYCDTDFDQSTRETTDKDFLRQNINRL